MSVLRLSRVSVRLGEQRLFTPLTLTAEPGKVTAIVGRSGAGKSSLLSFLCGLLKAPLHGDGEVLLDSEPLHRLPPESRRLGLMFQDPLLFPHLTVADNLAFGLRARMSARRRLSVIRGALESVGLAGFEDRDPDTLSGGERTRVALMRMMLAEPRGVLLDEPFASLDPETRATTRALVFDELRRRRLPALLVTHDTQDIEAAGGPVIILATPQE